MSYTTEKQQEVSQQWEKKKVVAEEELAKLGVSSERLFLWRIDVMVSFSRLKMADYEFRQSILGEKAYTECLLRHIIRAEYSLVMTLIGTEDKPEIDYGKYEHYLLILLNKAANAYIINECIYLIIHDRKLKEKKQWKSKRK